MRVEGMGLASVDGYVPHDWPRGSEHARMGMRFSLNQAGDFDLHDNWIATLAHEMCERLTKVGF